MPFLVAVTHAPPLRHCGIGLITVFLSMGCQRLWQNGLEASVRLRSRHRVASAGGVTVPIGRR